MQLEAQAREGALNRANALKVAGMRGAGKKTTKAEEIASWVAGMRAQGINPTREQILAKFGGTGQGRNTLNPIQLRNAAIAWWRERGVQNPTEKQIAQVALTGKREGYKRPVQPFATPKQGYEYVRNPDGSVKVGPDGRPVQYKVEGGPAKDNAEKEAAAKAEEGKQSQQTYNTVVKAIDDFNDIYLDSKLPVTGTIGVLASNIPGTPQYEAGKALETLKSQIGLGRLAQMKKLSATGASGFGALSQKELDLLVNSIASIDQGLTYARLQKNLDYVRRIFSDRAKAASLAAIPNDPNAPLPTALPGGGSGQGSAPTGGMDADKAILGIE
ncbi:MAG: hypothetical protein F4233_16115 [Rhodospirillaceae bacterium]|nr:hypothetical protein [Rhodospirillaceae bacterium]